VEITAESDALVVLSRLLSQRLVVVDVGARWGFAQAWDRLREKCLTIGFEPDEEECARLSEIHRGDQRMRFVPVALGAQSGLATLYLTRDRKGCSIYPPATEAVTRHPGLTDGQLEDTSVIELMALDDWCAAEGIGQVDAMKIDTQGSELDVLRGAEATLGSVRLIEVEVEFNELYEGIALFPAVDQYLRQQGFVLWKLGNLAHYAQAGMRTEWQTTETSHYDDVMSTFPAGAGQLFWANAVYLRRACAYPDPDAGWQSLVRDACITSAHKLFDLSSLALELARSTAPDDVAAEIDAALSAELLQIRREKELVERSAELTGTFRIDVADPSFVGGGWYPPQVLPYGGVRWSGPGRDAWVDLPVAVRPGTRIELLAVGFMTPQIAEALAFELNGVPVRLRTSPHEHGTVYSGVVPDGYRSPRRFTRLMMHTLTPVRWNEANPGSDDDTELGAAVSWIRLTAPDAEADIEG
jgi:FkbM family methyltransferase